MDNIRDLINSQPDVFSILKQIGKIADNTNKKVYGVGGVVRDLFLKKEIKEVDLMVIGDGVEFARLVADKIGISKIVPFPKFSTAHIPNKPIAIEIAAARQETYSSDSRKPETIKYTDLKGDLIRRDFTINAMAVNITPKNFGKLYDPYNGLSDLKSKRLVTPLEPNKTFSEDPLRMVRAAYFASKLDLKIEPDCIESMKNQAERIKIVSQERITNEFTKILSTDKPSKGLILLQETGLMSMIFPEIDVMYGMDQSDEWHHKDIFYHTMEVVDNAATLSKKMKLRFAALVHDIAKPNTRKIDPRKGYTFHGHDAIGERMLNKVSARMKLPNSLKEYLKKLTLLHLRPIALAKKGISDSAVRRLMVAAGEDVTDLLTLCRADITTKNPNKIKKYLSNFEKVESKMLDVSERDKMKAFQSPVRGKEIMKMLNMDPGKVIGEIKSEIEEAILDGKIENSYEEAIKYLSTIKKRYTQN